MINFKVRAVFSSSLADYIDESLLDYTHTPEPYKTSEEGGKISKGTYLNNLFIKVIGDIRDIVPPYFRLADDEFKGINGKKYIAEPTPFEIKLNKDVTIVVESDNKTSELRNFVNSVVKEKYNGLIPAEMRSGSGVAVHIHERLSHASESAIVEVFELDHVVPRAAGIIPFILLNKHKHHFIEYVCENYKLVGSECRGGLGELIYRLEMEDPKRDTSLALLEVILANFIWTYQALTSSGTSEYKKYLDLAWEGLVWFIKRWYSFYYVKGIVGGLPFEVAKSNSYRFTFSNGTLSLDDGSTVIYVTDYCGEPLSFSNSIIATMEYSIAKLKDSMYDDSQFSAHIVALKKQIDDLQKKHINSSVKRHLKKDVAIMHNISSATVTALTK